MGGLTPRSGLVIVEEEGLQATELSRVLCTKVAECNLEELGALTQQECALYFALPCFLFSDVRAEDGLAECLASIRSASCAGDEIFTDTCETAIRRARARQTGIPVQTMEGGRCGEGVECTDGMSCDGNGGGQCGACFGGPGIGDSCSAESCWTGYCDPQTSVCAREKADGAACGSDEECDSFNCSANGLCKPFVEDEPFCSLDDDCSSGRCVDGACVDSAPPGGRCERSADCDQGLCDEGVCKLVARCSLGEAGESCGTAGCGGNLECIDGVCVQLAGPGGPNGAACSSQSDCASGFCSFDGSVSVCAARPANQPCDDDAQCASGACVSYRCAGTMLCAP